MSRTREQELEAMRRAGERERHRTTRHEQEADIPEPTDTPRVQACIDAVMKRYRGIGPAAQARYFEAVHQELAPLARELEREVAELRAQAGLKPR